MKVYVMKVPQVPEHFRRCQKGLLTNRQILSSDKNINFYFLAFYSSKSSNVIPRKRLNDRSSGSKRSI